MYLTYLNIKNDITSSDTDYFDSERVSKLVWYEIAFIYA